MDEKEKKIMIQKIKENLDLLYEIDKNSFSDAIEDYSSKIGKVKKVVGEIKSITFDVDIVQESLLIDLDLILKDLMYKIKKLYGKGDDFLFNEIALFKIYGMNYIPVYFMTMIPERFVKFKTNIQKLSVEVEKNLKAIGEKLTNIDDGKLYYSKERKYEEFDMVYKKGKYLIGFNNFFLSISEIEDNYGIGINIIASEMEKYLNQKIS